MKGRENYMAPNLYIRHAVGSRLLLDCRHDELPFGIIPQEGKWRIVIGNVHRDTYELLDSNGKELNLFVVNNREKSTEKDWYYASDYPELSYSDEDKTVTIVVDSKMSYEG
jgi:hypothetical protein